MAKIESDDKNKNYLVYFNMKQFLLRLFSLFGVNVQIVNPSIDTDNDYITAKHKISPPIVSVDSNIIVKQAETIKAGFSNNKKDGEFYNLIEANKDLDIVHRFRSVFAVFDSIAPKQQNSYHINYDALKGKYAGIIESLYKCSAFTRYHETIKELVKANLIDRKNRNKVNYSQKLDQTFTSMGQGTIINEDVAFNLLKCIQIVRNKINHGDFEGLTPKMIAGTYELLLPLT